MRSCMVTMYCTLFFCSSSLFSFGTVLSWSSFHSFLSTVSPFYTMFLVASWCRSIVSSTSLILYFYIFYRSFSSWVASSLSSSDCSFFYRYLFVSTVFFFFLYIFLLKRKWKMNAWTWAGMVMVAWYMSMVDGMVMAWILVMAMALNMPWHGHWTWMNMAFEHEHMVHFALSRRGNDGIEICLNQYVEASWQLTPSVWGPPLLTRIAAVKRPKINRRWYLPRSSYWSWKYARRWIYNRFDCGDSRWSNLKACLVHLALWWTASLPIRWT